MTAEDSIDLLQADLSASGASPFGREAAERERRSRERSSFVPRHMKSDEGLFWKSKDFEAEFF